MIPLTRRPTQPRGRSMRPLAAALPAVLLLALLPLLGGCGDEDIQTLVGPRYTIGNTAPLGSGGQAADNLQGTRIVVPRDTHLFRFGLIATSGAGTLYQMALYADSAGTPTALVATSPPGVILVGPQEVTIPPVPLAAGTYWLMAVYNAALNIGWVGGVGELNAYKPQPFGTALPNPLVSPTLTALGRFNYWVVVQD